MTLVTILLLVLFIGLGRWQWQRGEARQAMWDGFERNSKAVSPGTRDIDTLDRFARLELNGEFDAAHQFLLDNRSHAGSPGYEVLTPFRTSDGRRVLVNRGWVPFGGYRDRLPDVSMTAAPTTIRGRIDELPTSGLSSGRAAPDPNAPWPRVTSFPTHDELASALGVELQRRILLLDPEVPGGYVREWSPPGMAPSRHFSYAIQWWGFAVVLLVLYFGLNFRKVP